MRKTVKNKCIICSKSFLVPPYEIKRGRGQCCSHACASRKGKQVNCWGSNNNNWKGDDAKTESIYGRQYRERHPKKAKAHRLVRNAIRDGLLKRGSCEICGTSNNVHGHHHDYNKPLDVTWLCHTHHIEEHRQREP